MKYILKETTRFKKDYERAMKRDWNIEALDAVITMLACGKPLPARCKDHPLKGDMKGLRECHVEPDWLLVYYIKKNVLVLVLHRTGTQITEINFHFFHFSPFSFRCLQGLATCFGNPAGNQT